MTLFSVKLRSFRTVSALFQNNATKVSCVCAEERKQKDVNIYQYDFSNVDDQRETLCSRRTMVGDLDSSRGDCRHCHTHKILELSAKRRLMYLIFSWHRRSIERFIFSIN